jgi:hypothetical protein
VPPDNSLNVPLEGGLLGPIPVVGATFSGTDVGSEGACFFDSFLPPELKLPSTICREYMQIISIIFLSTHVQRTNKLRQ